MSGVNRRDLQILTRVRLAEAKTLLSAGLPDGAYYLAGYAIECAFKACIARGTQRHDFPDRKSVDASHTHNLRELVKVANLELARLEEVKRDLFFATIGILSSSGRSRAVTEDMNRKLHRRWSERLQTGTMECSHG